MPAWTALFIFKFVLGNKKSQGFQILLQYEYALVVTVKKNNSTYRRYFPVSNQRICPQISEIGSRHDSILIECYL